MASSSHQDVQPLSFYFNQLDTQGYTVIPGVVPRDDLDKCYRDFMTWLVTITMDKFIDKEWSINEAYKELLDTHGIITYPRELSHTRFVNDIRGHENVEDVYRQFYQRGHEVNPASKPEPMMHSFDRINFQLSPSDKGKSYRALQPWWHVDQRSSEVDFKCIQGYVDINGSSDPSLGCLQVIAKSHLQFKDFAEKLEDKQWLKNDWRKFSLDELDFLFPDWVRHVVSVPSTRGSLVLWDSRLLHQAKRNTNSPFQDPFLSTHRRFVIYTCFWPARLISTKQFKAREKFMTEFLPSSHWPDCRKTMQVRQTYGATDINPYIAKWTRLLFTHHHSEKGDQEDWATYINDVAASKRNMTRKRKTYVQIHDSDSETDTDAEMQAKFQRLE